MCTAPGWQHTLTVITSSVLANYTDEALPTFSAEIQFPVGDAVRIVESLGSIEDQSGEMKSTPLM
jgi:hypothetical protein